MFRPPPRRMAPGATQSCSHFYRQIDSRLYRERALLLAAITRASVSSGVLLDRYLGSLDRSGRSRVAGWSRMSYTADPATPAAPAAVSRQHKRTSSTARNARAGGHLSASWSTSELPYRIRLRCAASSVRPPPQLAAASTDLAEMHDAIDCGGGGRVIGWSRQDRTASLRPDG